MYSWFTFPGIFSLILPNFSYTCKFRFLFAPMSKVLVLSTLVAVGLGWNATGALTMSLAAEVQWHWIPALIAGSLLGGYLGANTSVRSGNRTIKRVYELVTLIVGLKLLAGALL